MRFTCILKADKLPQAYNMLFVSLIKEVLDEESDGEAGGSGKGKAGEDYQGRRRTASNRKTVGSGKDYFAEPRALQLRQLQTLSEIAVEKNSTIVFPIPVEILKYFQNKS